MKYFYNLTIIGFLIPFFPLSAETALVETSNVSFVEQKQEASLLSLDEELSLLDEEFEEFKEELYSLDNDLQKEEKFQSPPVDTLLDLEKSHEEIAVFEEENNNQMDSLTFETFLPEIDTQDQTSTVSDSEFLSDDIGEFLPMMAESSDDSTFIENINLNEEQENHFLPVELTQETVYKGAPASLNVQETSLAEEPTVLTNDFIIIDLKGAFSGSPIIYSVLFLMSVIAIGIWLYSLLLLRHSARVSQILIKNLKNKLNSNNFEEALSLCQDRDNLLCKMVSSGIYSRRHGLQVMFEAMKAEGKRGSIAFWQKIGLLNDIAIIAPMLGLLGTVLGMFYAFYDVNRSIESISTLFDGLGISVGTTVAGLIVAITALILHSTAKYRLVRALALVENEAQNLATLIDDRISIYKGP